MILRATQEERRSREALERQRVADYGMGESNGARDAYILGTEMQSALCPL